MNEDEHRAGPGLTICALLLPELSTIPPSSGLSSFLPSFLALVNTHTRARTGGQIVCMQTDREWSGRTQRFACGRPLRTWLSLWNYVPADFRDSLMGRGNDWIMARSHISQSAEVTPFTRFFFSSPSIDTPTWQTTALDPPIQQQVARPPCHYYFMYWINNWNETSYGDHMHSLIVTD